MASIDQKIARAGTGGLPVFLQRKIKFVEAVVEDTGGKSSVGYASKRRRTGADGAGAADGPKEMLFDKALIDGNMAWSRVHHIGPGLQNLGNTCFLNSVLQCLVYTAPFANVLLQRLHGQRCRVEGFCIVCEMERHVQKTFAGAHAIRHISPNGVVAHLKLIGKHFKLGRQEDAHEFLRYLVEAMQKGCLAGLDAKLPARVKETTMVHGVFGGYLQSKVTCHSCRAESSVHEPLLDLSLEVKSAGSVHAALRQFTAPELLTRQNRYRCEACSSLADATKQFKVHSAPNILTVQLKRFQMHMQGMTKIHRDVDFTPELDLTPFMSDDKAKVLYDLYAVLVHEGQSCHSGHYFCFVKGSSGMWYAMNDERVHQVSLGTVLRQKAYILFYEKRAAVKSVGLPAAAEKTRPAVVLEMTRPAVVPEKALGKIQVPEKVPARVPVSPKKAAVGPPAAMKPAAAGPPAAVKPAAATQQAGKPPKRAVEEAPAQGSIVSKSMWQLRKFLSDSSARVFPDWTVTELKK